MKFVYLNSNRSGVGDRLLDLILVYTYCKAIGGETLYLEWMEGNELTNICGNTFEGSLRRKLTPAREFDYLLKNLLNFIQLPSDIKFVDNQALRELSKNTDNFVFAEYVGMQYNLNTFFAKHNRQIPTKDWVDKYYEIFKSIKFINIPESVISAFSKHRDIITIHLRRGDKCRNDNKTREDLVNLDQLQDLNEQTGKYINQFINNGFLNLCFVSDEKNVKNEYIEKYKDQCNILCFDFDEITQTYVDLYCISQAKQVLMSQFISTFSVLGSLIGDVPLHYLIQNKIMTANAYRTATFYELHN
jgi:hypothetical protein